MKLDEVSSNAYECKMSKKSVILKKTFFGQKFPPIVSSKELRVDKETCMSIIKSRLCETRPFNCHNDICISHEPDFSDEYVWWDTKIFEYTRCSIQKIAINA